MGMVLELHTLGDENIERLLADPPLIWLMLEPEDPDIYASARREGRKKGLLGRLFGRGGSGGGGDPGGDDLPPTEFSLGPAENQVTDLDKAWHAIHYLLTGTADGGEPPLDFLYRGGDPVGDVEVGHVEVGHDPVRVMRADAVKEVRDALADLDRESLKERFDAEDMIQKDIYGAMEDFLDDDLEYFLGHFDTMKDFVGAAAEKDLGLVLVLT